MFRTYHLRPVAIIFILLGAYAPGAQAASPRTFFVTPLELNFGPVGVGQTSPQLVATITNTGTLPLTGWAGGAVPAPFNASQNCNIPGGVLPGNSCHYFFTFTPTSAGGFDATSTSSITAGSLSILLHGTGVGPSLAYDAHSVSFGNLYTNGIVPAVAPTQVVTIKNTGLTPLTGWAGGAVSAPFNASQDCNIPGGVLPGNTCHYFLSFSTSTVGTYSATSNSTASSVPISIQMSGATHGNLLPGGGQMVTPLSLDFGPVGVGTTGQTLTVTITNQDLLINITGWAGGGTSAPFGASQNCNIAGGNPPGSSCQFFYTFKPISAGVFNTTSNVSDSFGNFTINLQGTGVAPSMSADATWLDFGPVVLGHSGVQQIVTITNTGLSPLTNWAGGGVSSPFSSSQDCNIPGGVLPGNKCHFYYNYSPTAIGFFTASSSFSTNAGSITVKLQGGSLIPLYLPVVVH